MESLLVEKTPLQSPVAGRQRPVSRNFGGTCEGLMVSRSDRCKQKGPLMAALDLAYRRLYWFWFCPEGFTGGLTPAVGLGAAAGAAGAGTPEATL